MRGWRRRRRGDRDAPGGAGQDAAGDEQDAATTSGAAQAEVVPGDATDELGAPTPATPATPVERAFATYFATWGLFLPAAAVAGRAPGYLLGRGWSVRWRWHDDGSLEFLASHRMTNERWRVITPDGTERPIDVPFEAMIFPADATDDQRAAIERDYRAAWRAHGEAVARADMEPIQGRGPIPPELAAADAMTWRLDDGAWTKEPLRPTG